MPVHRLRKWQPTPVFLPGESHGQRSLEGYSPWGRKESDTTEQLTHTHAPFKNHLAYPQGDSSLILEALLQGIAVRKFYLGLGV